MDFKTEIAIYIFSAGVLSALRRIISGMKNGCFYAKGNIPLPKLLAKYVYNIHYLETPAWYTQFGFQFLLCLALYRTFHIDAASSSYHLCVLGAYLTTMGSSAIAGVFYQGYINISADKNFVDETENPKSEFAFCRIHFWWPRPWYGKRRIYASIFGCITLLCGIYVGIFLH